MVSDCPGCGRRSEFTAMGDGRFRCNTCSHVVPQRLPSSVPSLSGLPSYPGQTLAIVLRVLGLIVGIGVVSLLLVRGGLLTALPFVILGLALWGIAESIANSGRALEEVRRLVADLSSRADGSGKAENKPKP